MKKLFLFAALAAALLAGCSKEPAAEQMPGATRLSLTIDGEAIAVQGTRAVDESVVSNLWVLQFDASGAQLTRQYISSIADPASIELPTGLSKTANSTLYLVANTGNASLFTTQNLAQAKAATIALTTTTGAGIPANTSTTLPMVGHAALTLVSAVIPVNLTRVVSKVTLTVKNLLATGYPRLAVTSTQLKNVPKSYSTQVVDAANGFTNTTYYPSAAAANFIDYTATTGNITAAGTTTTYYVAPNVRGVSTNSVSYLKSDATAPSGQGTFCTYVEILGTARASASSPVVDVRYRLYLGGNNTNDFNLQSNTAYTVDIELAGLYVDDARLTITTDKFNLSQGTTDGDHTGDTGDGWTQPAIGEAKDGGIVYWVDAADATNYKVFSLDQGDFAWAAKRTYVLGVPGQSDTDGKANVAAMKAYSANTGTNGTTGTFATDFPAAAYCEGLGAGWYLPAKSELVALSTAYNTNKDVLDKTITANQGTDFPTNSDYFWSSTENSGDTVRAWFVTFSNGNTINNVKDSYDLYVRCIKSTAPPLKIGDLKDGGIVYWVDDADPTKYKVVALTDSNAEIVTANKTLKWAAQNTYAIGSGAQSDTDGKGNSAAIKSAFDNKMAGVAITESTFEDAFPAAAYCYNYKGKDGNDPAGTWYLPAKTELQYLWCAFNGKAPISWASSTNSAAPADTAAQGVFNGYLTAAGGTEIPASGTSWSSTENSGYTYNAWRVNFSDGLTNSYGKDYGLSVRCVRAN